MTSEHIGALSGRRQNESEVRDPNVCVSMQYVCRDLSRKDKGTATCCYWQCFGLVRKISLEPFKATERPAQILHSRLFVNKMQSETLTLVQFKYCRSSSVPAQCNRKQEHFH